MSSIFLSHSSANNAEAIAIRDWMIEHGWNDLFLDLDPERGLKAGAKWQGALKRAADQCELVVVLISPAWAASKWCLAEFLLANSLGKRILGVIVAPTPFGDLPAELTNEWQLVDLTAGNRDYKATVVLPPGDVSSTVAFSAEGLNRLRIGLAQSGLDAKYFTWPPEHDPQRSPYRGLRPLEAEDAGIFFGRDGQIVIGTNMLRSMKEAAAPRLLVILGASGSGKSSFMRAGLLPRLERESEHFSPLPIVRPGRAVISGDTGLIACLNKELGTVGSAQSRAAVRDTVSSGIEGVRELLTTIIEGKAREQDPGGEGLRKPPILILPIDQAEELFSAEGREEAETFLSLLRELATTNEPPLIVLFTIRSDQYELLQSSKHLASLRQEFLSLPPMPHGAYRQVITGPAIRLKGSDRALTIGEPLVDALLADIEAGGAKDALPLLAFTLERLYQECGGDGDLTLEEYRLMGGVKGAIEAAVEKALSAADGNGKIPQERAARLALLRRGLVPWLAGIDADTGMPCRTIARVSEIPEEARPLMDLLVDQRLLATDVDRDSGEKTVEPAHEALLRQWGVLRGWLKEDTSLLGVLEGIKRGSRDWAANGKENGWITHSAYRLADAEKLGKERPDLACKLEPTDRDYLTACRALELSARKKDRRVRFAIGSLLVMLVAASTIWAWQDELIGHYQWYVKMNPEVLSRNDEESLLANLSQLNAVDPKICNSDRKIESGSFTECKNNCPTMVVVPAGKFERKFYDYYPRESLPSVTVEICQPFAVSETEVTLEQWQACVAARICKPLEHRPWEGENLPVTLISWREAKLYTQWLSGRTGKEYRLLTEAEWEYAARGGATTQFPFGDDIEELGDYAWYSGNSKIENKLKSQDTAMRPVGAKQVKTKKPNCFGLHDMLGNVHEWVEDCYVDNYIDVPTDGTAVNNEICIEKDGSPGKRVLRGFAFDYPYNNKDKEKTYYQKASDRSPSSWAPSDWTYMDKNYQGVVDKRARFFDPSRRNKVFPFYQDRAFGFRVARTMGEPACTSSEAKVASVGDDLGPEQ